ncbi:hypothetical protein C0993_011066 [Termitomyces sp. T159_Od127]|nr:hypothetical protein C0993_011066 [Termitomyces sp. T159_Od127]
MSADGVTGNLSLSKEGLFILSVAAEEFIKKMAQAGHLRASNERRTAVDYSDMWCAVHANLDTKSHRTFQRRSPSPFLSARPSACAHNEKKKPKNPTPPRPRRHPPAHPCPSPAPRKPKAGPTAPHQSMTNGPPRTRAPPTATPPTLSGPTRGRSAISAYNGRLSLAARLSPLANGHSVSAAPSRSGTITPAQSHDPASDAASTQHQPSATASPYPAQPEESWSAQLPYATGPASGFLQGPGGPFGRVLQNPGHTIYSQEYRAE